MVARINTKIETEEMEITEAVENMSSRTFFSTKKTLYIHIYVHCTLAKRSLSNVYYFV